MLVLREQGLTIKAIAQEMQRSAASVRKRIPDARDVSDMADGGRPSHVTATPETTLWWAQNAAAFTQAMLHEHPLRWTGGEQPTTADYYIPYTLPLLPAPAFGRSSLA